MSNIFKIAQIIVSLSLKFYHKRLNNLVSTKSSNFKKQYKKEKLDAFFISETEQTDSYSI